jgi:hypothetical protein
MISTVLGPGEAANQCAGAEEGEKGAQHAAIVACRLSCGQLFSDITHLTDKRCPSIRPNAYMGMFR